MDERGFSRLPAVVRTSALCGEPPLLRPVLSREHLSVMGAITPTEPLDTLVRQRALTGQESPLFLEPLLRHGAERRLVIWDGSSIHWAAEVKTFLANGGAKAIHLELLPGYAPALNPVEGIWDLLT